MDLSLEAGRAGARGAGEIHKAGKSLITSLGEFQFAVLLCDLVFEYLTLPVGSGLCLALESVQIILCLFGACLRGGCKLGDVLGTWSGIRAGRRFCTGLAGFGLEECRGGVSEIERKPESLQGDSARVIGENQVSWIARHLLLKEY